MGVEYNEISKQLREVVQFYMNSTGVANWEHSTMNVWQAWKLFSEVAANPILPGKLAPGIFYYHRYLTGGRYNLKDMEKTFDEIDPLGKSQIDLHKQIIQDYKQKKLEWTDE